MSGANAAGWSDMTRSKEDAVSPVIGVILMVAVTVILAAVIAAFVFGMGSNISKSKSVAMTSSRSADGTALFVTYQGGQDHLQVANVSATVEGLSVDGTPFSTTAAPAVGQAVKYITATPGTKYHVTASATFTDGTAQVILDTYV